MSKNENDYTLSVNNQKIHSFYRNHSTINFEQANLLLIEFLDTMFNSITNDLDSNINSKLLSYMTSNKEEITALKDNIHSMNETMSKMNISTINSVNEHLMKMKTDYIEEVNRVITNGNFTVGEKISSIMEKNSEHILDKTTILLNDVVPKSQERLHATLQSNLKDLHADMNKDVSKMIGSVSNEQALHAFLVSFETLGQSIKISLPYQVLGKIW